MSGTYVGIDPGVNGGIAVLRGCEILAITETPSTIHEILAWMQDHISVEDLIGIEQVTGYIPRESNNTHKHGGQPASSAFQFGVIYGILQTAIIAKGLNAEPIRPREWQSGLSIFPRDKHAGETQPQFKSRLNRFAKSLFPAYEKQITLKTCDSVLIAEYLRRSKEL